MRRSFLPIVCGALLPVLLPVSLAAADTRSLLGTTSPEGVVTRGQAVIYLYDLFENEIKNDAAAAPQVSFMDIPAQSPVLPLLARFCVAEAISCTGGDFLPDQPVSMPALLKMYDHLLHHYRKVPFKSLVEDKSSRLSWSEQYMNWGKEHGLVPADTLMVPITHKTVEDFLSRDAYLRDWHYALPSATPRIPDTLDKVNDTTILTREDLNIMRDLVQTANLAAVQRLMDGSAPFRAPQDILVAARLRGYKAGLDQLALFMDQHPLYYDASFSPEERAEFRKLGLKEVIGVGDYDFRTNPAYRKHNIRATLKHIHKLVLQPGEEFDYWKTMYAGGLNEVGNGWVILEGKEVWAWGGGLCGTATAIFRGAWFAGLEITDRKPHSIYYPSLYGRDLGLDATVYQDSPNLRFKNNTGNPIMLYLRYNETQDFSHVYVLGTKHFTSFEFVKGARRGRSIQHERVLTMKDGTVWKDPLYSAYNKIE